MFTYLIFFGTSYYTFEADNEAGLISVVRRELSAKASREYVLVAKKFTAPVSVSI